MSVPRRIVIVGAGQSGLQVALSLRERGYSGALALVGEEAEPPYHRPPLSKKAIISPMRAEQLEIRAPKVLADARIDLHLGRRAVALDPKARAVTLDDGARLACDALVLAIGVKPRRLPLERRNLFTLRQLGEAAAIQARLADARRVAIVGGGYIGLEAAAALRASGREVTVLEMADRLLARVTTPTMSDYFAALHRSHGVALHLGARVASFEGDGELTALHLADGTRIGVDLVIAGIGNVMDTALAAQLGLDAANGIAVDAFCRAGVPHLYAVGDCARFPSQRYGREVRLESVQHAVDHAKACAAAIMGAGEAYDPVPWFWSDQYDVKLQIAGLSQGHDRAEVAGDMAAHKFSVSYRAGGRLLAVDSVNDARAHMLARREIAAG